MEKPREDTLDDRGVSLEWSIVSAVNNDRLARVCLLGSPDVSKARTVILQRGFSNAGKAFNDALEKAQSDLVVIAHQDIFLPQDWLAKLQEALQYLERHDPGWGVLGLWGIRPGGREVGHVYCTGVGRLLGEPFSGAVEVQSLDEIVLVVRRSSGLRFDESMPGFHMYGTDICLEARRQGRKAYAISAFCIHNTNGYNQLPLQFWKLYLRMRRKWKAELPISTSCIRITFGCYPMFRWIVKRSLNLLLGRHRTGKRVEDPLSLYREILAKYPALGHRSSGS